LWPGASDTLVTYGEINVSDSVDPIAFQERCQWRAWLEENHQLEPDAWLLIHKRAYEDRGLGLAEAVEEALCFGWIDSHMKSLDEKTYVLRFSPRTGASIWSMSNIQRVEQLIQEGRMTDAGLQKIAEAKESGQWAAAIRREQVDVIPDVLERALEKHEGGVAAYRALPDSRRKQIIYWLQSAKRQETIDRRIQSVVKEVLGR
jgi:uncharacterized protein YdeI (YjbR/CyaY-like superfamily)